MPFLFRAVAPIDAIGLGERGDVRDPLDQLLVAGRGRLEGQAPDIDPVVYLTDCDPSAFSPGQLIRARVVGARGYDLIASPDGGGGGGSPA